MLHATMQVLRFELTRTLTLGRIVTWVALGIFPSLLIALLQLQARGEIPYEVLAMICYMLVPQISCMLGLLLWATPAIGAELEAQSWIYLTLRQHGRVGIALGKYLVAFLWTASYGVVSAVGVSLLSGVDEMFRWAGVLTVLVLLSSACYSALYLLIGAVVYRRATVVAVVYSLVLEGFVSWIPATINKLTVSYRLRSLLAEWLSLRRIQTDGEMNVFFGTEPVWYHALALLLYAGGLLFLAVYVIRGREYPVQTDE